MRCFIGSFISDRDRAEIQRHLPQLPGVRWTKANKYHITYEFFPNLDASEIDAVKSNVESLSASFPIQGQVTIFTGFPRASRARVLVLRVELDTAIEDLFKDPDPKPHITVGYARKRTTNIEEIALDVPISLNSVNLIESKDREYQIMF